MKPKKIAVLVVALALVSQISNAQEMVHSGKAPGPVSNLGAALDEAEKSNPEILVSKTKWEEERARIISAGAPPDPEVGVEFWGKNETWYDVSQKVPFPVKLPLRAQSQAHEANREKGYYRAKQKEILQKVKAAYYAYFLAWKEIEIFEESVSFLKQFSVVTENKYSVNQTSQANVLKAQLEYSKTLNTLETLKQEKEARAAELNALFDRAPDAALPKPAEPSLPDISLDYASLEKIAWQNRPELHAARHHVDHMGADLALAQADFLPDATLQYSRRTFKDQTPDDNIVMVKFNVPFLWFWRQGAAVGAAAKAKEGAEAELRSLETLTRSDLKSLLVKTQNARRLVELYRTTTLPQSEAALKVSLKGYEAGTEGFVDVIDSERSRLGFQLEYYQALAEYWSYLASLERLVGKDLS
ncbi:MAG: TolC family protein [Candidatus Omnitrophica bacterium]|nr:TolC family protein [Candidatus Omnitrophota bacterium]